MGDHVRCAGQDHLNHEQDRGHKQERKFQGLCNSRQHTGQSCGKKKSSCLFFLLRFGAAVHGKGRSRKTEDHKDKFSGEVSGSVCTEVHGAWICQLGKENVLASLDQLSGHFHGTSHSRLPEWKVEYMVKSKGDQGSFNDTEDKGSHIAGSCNQTAQGIDSVLYYRPRKIHGNSNQKINHGRNDRYKSGSPKKGKRIWKLNLVKTVMKGRYAQSHDNTSKNSHLQSGNTTDFCDGSRQYRGGNGTVLQDLSLYLEHCRDGGMHNKERDHSCESCHFFFLLRHTDGYSYCKDQGQIVKNNISRLTHNSQQGIQKGSVT